MIIDEFCQLNLSSNIVEIKKFIDLLSPLALIAWKDTHSIFQGCNELFSRMARLHNPEDIIGKSISQLKPLHPECAKGIQELDRNVIDSMQCIDIDKLIYFENDDAPYTIKSKTLPIVNENEKIQGVLVICIPIMSLFEETENIFHLINKEKIGSILKLEEYTIKFRYNTVLLSKKKMTCLLYLMKGMTAKRIANEMEISLRTVEAYIDILKETVGCHTKSELISLAFESNLLKVLKGSIYFNSNLKIENHLKLNLLHNMEAPFYLKI